MHLFYGTDFLFIIQKLVRPVSSLSTVRGLHKSALNGEPALLLHTYFIGQIELKFKVTGCTRTYSSDHLVDQKAMRPEMSYPFHLFSVMEQPTSEETVTSSFGRFIQSVQPKHLSPVVLQRSKRMLLDSIGVGLLGSTTEVFELVLQHCQVIAQKQ